MNEKNINWIRENKHKMCPNLFKELIQLVEITSNNIFTKTIYRIKRHITKLPIIIEYINNNVRSSNNNKNNKKKTKSFDTVPCIATKLSPKQIEELIKDENIKKIHYDIKVKALLDNAIPSVNAPLLWSKNLTGKNVTIAIIDTGIYPHKDLTTPQNRILYFKDFINNKKTPYDDNGHGTHCAGDAAGNGTMSKGLYKGPAYDANLIGVKVLDKNGSGNISTIIRGLEWCIKNKSNYNIKIISLSLGYLSQSSYKDDLLCRVCENAYTSGIIVCCAAGNDGPKKNTINSPGIDPYVITVGSVNDKNTSKISDDSISSFSSRGPTTDGIIKPDFVVPGDNITSLAILPKLLPFKGGLLNPNYTSKSGTSMATPICAGLIAQILEYVPNLAPQQVKDILVKSVRKISNNKKAQGYGYIDINIAYKEISKKLNK